MKKFLFCIYILFFSFGYVSCNETESQTRKEYFRRATELRELLYGGERILLLCDEFYGKVLKNSRKKIGYKTERRTVFDLTAQDLRQFYEHDIVSFFGKGFSSSTVNFFTDCLCTIIEDEIIGDVLPLVKSIWVVGHQRLEDKDYLTREDLWFVIGEIKNRVKEHVETFALQAKELLVLGEPDLANGDPFTPQIDGWEDKVVFLNKLYRAEKKRCLRRMRSAPALLDSNGMEQRHLSVNQDIIFQSRNDLFLMLQGHYCRKSLEASFGDIAVEEGFYYWYLSPGFLMAKLKERRCAPTIF